MSTVVSRFRRTPLALSAPKEVDWWRHFSSPCRHFGFYRRKDPTSETALSCMCWKLQWVSFEKEEGRQVKGGRKCFVYSLGKGYYWIDGMPTRKNQQSERVVKKPLQRFFIIIYFKVKYSYLLKLVSRRYFTQHTMGVKLICILQSNVFSLGDNLFF